MFKPRKMFKCDHSIKTPAIQEQTTTLQLAE